MQIARGDGECDGIWYTMEHVPVHFYMKRTHCTLGVSTAAHVRALFAQAIGKASTQQQARRQVMRIGAVARHCAGTLPVCAWTRLPGQQALALIWGNDTVIKVI